MRATRWRVNPHAYLCIMEISGIGFSYHVIHNIIQRPVVQR